MPIPADVLVDDLSPLEAMRADGWTVADLVEQFKVGADLAAESPRARAGDSELLRAQERRGSSS